MAAERKSAKPVAKGAKAPKPVAKPAKPVAKSPKPAKPAIADDLLDTRALNRALLARQLLLERSPLSPTAAIAHLVALQAQAPRPPFIGLWTRLQTFSRDQLHKLLHDRGVVRATFLRGTLHLLTAADFLAFRPALQPMLTAGFQAILKDRAAGLDLARLAAFAESLLPATFDDLRPMLAAEFHQHDDRALGYALRMNLPLVQVPTDDAWAFPAGAAFASARAWLTRDVPTAATADALTALVRRYLAAFGPATIKDAQRWSGIADLAPAFAALRPELVTFRDDKRRELFDLPDAPRPAADREAPVRFIPDFDNLVLGHDDRRRIIADEHRPQLVTKNLLVRPTFLVDGFVAGTWTIERHKHGATLTLAPFAPISGSVRDELYAEGGALLQLVEPDAESWVVTGAR
ncbi:MAG TPA: winged helix DNA-binding domain-containing protein [Kofleriaceae bacterium]